jgi:hypothetical protein
MSVPSRSDRPRPNSAILIESRRGSVRRLISPRHNKEHDPGKRGSAGDIRQKLRLGNCQCTHGAHRTGAKSLLEGFTQGTPPPRKGTLTCRGRHEVGTSSWAHRSVALPAGATHPNRRQGDAVSSEREGRAAGVDRQARWARSRCTVPDTPLSSTEPMSPNAIPFSCEASATDLLTSTSPGRA